MPVTGEVDWRRLLSGVGEGRPLSIGDSLSLYAWISQLEDTVAAAAAWVEARKGDDTEVEADARAELEEAVLLLEPVEDDA